MKRYYFFTTQSRSWKALFPYEYQLDNWASNIHPFEWIKESVIDGDDREYIIIFWKRISKRQFKLMESIENGDFNP